MKKSSLNEHEIRRFACALASHRGIDPAASVMAGAVAVARGRGHFSASPTAEERAELLALAGHADDFQAFVEAATARAYQFLSPAILRLILERAERLSRVLAATA